MTEPQCSIIGQQNYVVSDIYGFTRFCSVKYEHANFLLYHINSHIKNHDFTECFDSDYRSTWTRPNSYGSF